MNRRSFISWFLSALLYTSNECVTVSSFSGYGEAWHLGIERFGAFSYRDTKRYWENRKLTIEFSDFHGRTWPRIGVYGDLVMHWQDRKLILWMPDYDLGFRLFPADRAVRSDLASIYSLGQRSMAALESRSGEDWTESKFEVLYYL